MEFDDLAPLPVAARGGRGSAPAAGAAGMVAALIAGDLTLDALA